MDSHKEGIVHDLLRGSRREGEVRNRWINLVVIMYMCAKSCYQTLCAAKNPASLRIWAINRNFSSPK